MTASGIYQMIARSGPQCGRPAQARASPRAWGGAAAICALSQTRVIQGPSQGLRPGI